MKRVIVYYSLSGNTRFAAEQIARRLGADLLPIAPEKAYPDRGFRKFFWGGKSAVMAETPALQPYRPCAPLCATTSILCAANGSPRSPARAGPARSGPFPACGTASAARRWTRS